jgi:hypothetical protein
MSSTTTTVVTAAKQAWKNVVSRSRAPAVCATTLLGEHTSSHSRRNQLQPAAQPRAVGYQTSSIQPKDALRRVRNHQQPQQPQRCFSSSTLTEAEPPETAAVAAVDEAEPIVRGAVVSKEDVQKEEVKRKRLSEVRGWSKQSDTTCTGALLRFLTFLLALVVCRFGIFAWYVAPFSVDCCF